jgi:hypothetical protein
LEDGPAGSSSVGGSVPLPSGEAGPTQQFPAGTARHVANCAGLCGRDGVIVACARVGKTWRLAVDLHLCAECLADFAVGAPVMCGHVYVLCTDDLYREVTT